MIAIKNASRGHVAGRRPTSCIRAIGGFAFAAMSNVPLICFLFLLYNTPTDTSAKLSKYLIKLIKMKGIVSRIKHRYSV